MDTVTRSAPSAPAAENEPTRAPGPIIVATDGARSADAALVAARCIHERTGFTVQLLSVLEPMSPVVFTAMTPFGYSPAMPAPALDTDNVRMHVQEDLVKQQLRRVEGEDSSWRVKIKLGRPAAEIAQTARRRHAELIITGMNQHGVVDRLLGNETPIHVAQLGDTPLLAASASFAGMPKHVVIATDLFSPAIDRLAEESTARVLLAGAKTVYFVHVVPEIETWGLDHGYWNERYGQAVNEAFAHLKEVLRLAPDVHVEMITPTGDPAREILDFAAFSKIDLIVVGRREASIFERRVGGGIAAKVLRGATCSVLLLPPSKAKRSAQPTLAPGDTETVTDRQQWPTRLMNFNRRNVGRRASLEIDDFDFGAQLQLTGYPLLGVEYDHRSGKLDLMLGDARPSPRHLQHGIPSPESLSILVGADGRDSALSIAYPRGYALLTFDR